ncbi:Hypothetical protein KFL_003360060 [Klebsormidium nitens]|uniref:KIF-binding protein n=1 Tax=Klebsormidium nitens TaxID=105231 RepID=A0A1Y1I867_KLENI|nr:Hypothetical protein KFL_003360060 [Klebsormidium nitens]|eukprot:GAQ87174.1 Hypothetical protein KFL_003360060 [Klebsormidium nitens]
MSRNARNSRWKDGKKGEKAKDVLTPVQLMLAEASRLKQAAERKTAGREAAALFEQSADKYRASLQLDVTVSQRLDALNDLGEAYLEWSASLLAHLRSGPASFDSGSEERGTAVHMAVASLCNESNSAYEAIISEAGTAPDAQASANTSERASAWLEATVNSGNALAEWADALAEIPKENGGGAQRASTLLERAEGRYSAALELQKDDIETLTNFGDCLVRHAEMLCGPFPHSSRPAEWDQAGPLFERAMQAYAAGCSVADVRLGDDLAGLLLNWGAGLFSAAQRCPETTAALALFAQAEEKLRHGADFSRTDVAPRVTLGDTLSGHGERAHAGGHVAEAYSLLTCAVDEGYGAALRIDRNNVDAKLGVADVFLLAGKLKHKDGDAQASHENFERSTAAYREALGGQPAGLGFAEWCDAMYNYACAAALAGHEDEVRGALTKLQGLRRLRADELAADDDLASCRNKEWFQDILKDGSL